MRVAIIKSNGYFDQRVLRVIESNGINGDIVDKFTRDTMMRYDAVIFSYHLQVPNIQKVLERIVLEKKIHVVYITNTASIGQFYNLFDDLFFNYVQEHKLDVVLSTILRHTKKYLKQISYLEDKNQQQKNEISLLKNTNKAKRVLMSKGLSEADSHEFIVQKAMSMRISKAKLVNLIIEEKIDI